MRVFSFDVESIGLYGPAFAVGYVVLDTSNPKVELESGIFSCDPLDVSGTYNNHVWVAANVPSLPITAENPSEMRSQFWDRWKYWDALGAYLCADVAYPVESNFLSECIRDGQGARDWEGPYPLIDIASIRFAKGLDPLATETRLESEMPAHNPLCDARQSARLLVEALSKGNV